MIIAVLLCPEERQAEVVLREALAAQTCAPDQIRVLDGPDRRRAPAFCRALEIDAGAPPDWWWLLDGSAVPEPDALERLLAPLRSLGPLPSPVLLASKIIDAGGELDPDRAPWPRLLGKEVSLDACERHLLSVRAARHGSLLVSGAAIARHGLPRADYLDGGEDLEWTARMLRSETGYLVPGSVAIRPGHLPGAPLPSERQLASRVNMLRGTAWAGEEKLWFAFLMLQDIARDLNTRPSRALSLAAQLRAGLRLRAR